MASRIALIIPYFGRWPEWMETYLYSCAGQPFDVHFFTDCPPLPASGNVIYHGCTFHDYCRDASRRLGIGFMPENPYKLCDLKPFYGCLHEDLLEGYEFWGFGDIDLVYGNMGAVLDAGFLDRVNVFSTMADRCSGHFCLMRNNRKFRNMAFRIRNWRKLLADPCNRIVDEKYFSDVMVPELKWERMFFARILIPLLGRKPAFRIHSFYLAPLVQALSGFAGRGIHMKEYGVTPEADDSTRYSYREGTICDVATGREAIYLHFLFFKKNLYRSGYLWDASAALAPDPGKLPGRTLYIDKTGLHF